MCGICGIAGGRPDSALEGMTRSLAHRGPDDRGSYMDPAGRVGLGHTRLAILDLTQTGHQPMSDPSGDVWIVYNGEVYNHLEIRRVLKDKYRFIGRSDTETILYSYLEWGIGCLERFNGMFALAIWDRRAERLWLARDRMGIKPLYYGQMNGQLRFASEIRAILADPAWPREPDPEAVDSFLRLRYVVHPRTLIKDIFSLPPGSTLLWEKGEIKIEPFWQIPWRERRSMEPKEASERFMALLADSVRLRLMSDVPLGVFLSGGLDSSLITSLAREYSNSTLQTFTVGFDVGDGEAAAAALVARELGCRHTAINCRPTDFAGFEDAVIAMDNPVADAVILPTYMLSRHAAGSVKTVLTGEGADELLAGYTHQRRLLRLEELSFALGLPGLRPLLALACKVLPMGFWDRLFGYGASLGKAGIDRLIKLVMEIDSATKRYLNFVCLFDNSERQRLYGPGLAPLADRNGVAGLDLSVLDAKQPDKLRGLMQVEFQAWLPDNILNKQDGLSMANSLEARVPFLDHRLVEEVVSWDPATFAKLSRNKALLRRHLAERHPRLPRRKKQPFMLNLDQNFKDVLLKLVQEHLIDQQEKLKDLIQVKAVLPWMDDLKNSPFIRSKQLVALLVLSIWLRRWL